MNITWPPVLVQTKSGEPGRENSSWSQAALTETKTEVWEMKKERKEKKEKGERCVACVAI